MTYKTVLICFTHSSIDEHLVCFHILVKQCCNKHGKAYMSLRSWFQFFGYIQRDGTAELSVSSIVIFWGNYTISTVGCTISQSYQQDTKVSISSQFHWCMLSFVFFFIVVILTCVRWYLTAVLIFMSLMISDVENFSYNYWPSRCFLWRDVYSSPLPIFNIGFCVCFSYQVKRVPYIFWIVYTA